MELLNQKPKKSPLFDVIRKKWVENTPEELIRQKLIQQMIEYLGYPPSLIAVEKELSQLPHLKHLCATLPRRRADILVFEKQSLLPLLLIECKSVPITTKFAQQVIGYNAFVKAPLVALSNGQQTLTGYFDSEAGLHKFEPGLPHFTLLSLNTP